MGLHNSLTWLSFLSGCSPKHKVLDVRLLKRYFQLKELSISPFGEARLERSSLSLFTRAVGVADLSKHVPQDLVGMGKPQGWSGCFS